MRQRQKLKIVFALGFFILALDQITKYLIVRSLPFGAVNTICPGFFDLVHARNTGAAFGFLAGWNSAYKGIFFYALSGVALYFLYSYLKQITIQTRILITPIGMIFGGALGNIADRIFRGSVVDFLSFHWRDRWLNWTWGHHTFSFPLTWPAFNVADSAITLGVLWLVGYMLFEPKFKKM